MENQRCNVYIQDTSHLFYNGLITRDFWYKVNEWLQLNHNIYVTLGIKIVLFGKIDGPILLNRILIYGKLFIYKCKYKDIQPELNSFVQWIAKSGFII